VPPLRDRLTDLPAMIDAFLREATIRGRARKLPVTPEAMRLLAAHAWPGNVRELRSEVHRWAVFCDDEVTPGDLAAEIREGAAGLAPRRSPPRRAHTTTLAATVRDAEHAAITAALAVHAGNLSQTARALGIERNTLKRKLLKLGLASAREA
jgi:DNA-binding NtrC family response regulator